MDKEEKVEVEKKAPKASLTREDLTSLIREVVQESIQPALEQVKAPQQKWGAYIMQSDSEKNAPRKPGPQEKGMAAARYVRALAASQGNPEKAVWWAQKAYDDELGDTVTKALAAGDFTAGGFMVPEDMSNDIIDLLRPSVVVRAAGAPVVPMPRGTLTLPKQTGDITATYVGENQNITKTEPTGGQIIMSAKKLAAVVPISNDLLDFAPGTSADMFVRNSLVRRIAVREDAAFIRDDGTAGTPKGLRYWAQTANVNASAGTSAANIETDFKDLLQDLEGNNVPMTRPVWIMAPRSKNHLLTLRDANGNLIYPELRMGSPTIHTYPVFTTNSIPTNLGGASNETEVYLVDMDQVLIGESGGMEIEVSREASYVESGSLVSAFSRDQTVIRTIMRHDFAAQYAEAIAIKNAITWGA
jgi:HK97 family phage major capsid protein